MEIYLKGPLQRYLQEQGKTTSNGCCNYGKSIGRDHLLSSSERSFENEKEKEEEVEATTTSRKGIEKIEKEERNHCGGEGNNNILGSMFSLCHLAERFSKSASFLMKSRRSHQHPFLHRGGTTTHSINPAHLQSQLYILQQQWQGVEIGTEQEEALCKEEGQEDASRHKTGEEKHRHSMTMTSRSSSSSRSLQTILSTTEIINFFSHEYSSSAMKFLVFVLFYFYFMRCRLRKLEEEGTKKLIWTICSIGSMLVAATSYFAIDVLCRWYLLRSLELISRLCVTARYLTRFLIEVELFGTGRSLTSSGIQLDGEGGANQWHFFTSPNKKRITKLFHLLKSCCCFKLEEENQKTVKNAAAEGEVTPSMLQYQSQECCGVFEHDVLQWGGAAHEEEKIRGRRRNDKRNTDETKRKGSSSKVQNQISSSMDDSVGSANNSGDALHSFILHSSMWSRMKQCLTLMTLEFRNPSTADHHQHATTTTTDDPLLCSTWKQTCQGLWFATRHIAIPFCFSFFRRQIQSIWKGRGVWNGGIVKGASVKEDQENENEHFSFTLLSKWMQLEKYMNELLINDEDGDLTSLPRIGSSTHLYESLTGREGRRECCHKTGVEGDDNTPHHSSFRIMYQMLTELSVQLYLLGWEKKQKDEAQKWKQSCNKERIDEEKLQLKTKNGETQRETKTTSFLGEEQRDEACIVTEIEVAQSMERMLKYWNFHFVSYSRGQQENKNKKMNFSEDEKIEVSSRTGEAVNSTSSVTTHFCTNPEEQKDELSAMGTDLPLYDNDEDGVYEQSKKWSLASLPKPPPSVFLQQMTVAVGQKGNEEVLMENCPSSSSSCGAADKDEEGIVGTAQTTQKINQQEKESQIITTTTPLEKSEDEPEGEEDMRNKNVQQPYVKGKCVDKEGTCHDGPVINPAGSSGQQAPFLTELQAVMRRRRQ